MNLSSNPRNLIKKKQISVLSIINLCTLALFFMMAGCGESVTEVDSSVNENNNENGTPTSNEIDMEGISFLPGNLTVEVGATVVWINKSNVIHTITSGTDGTHDGLFDSGNIAADEQFSYTFSEVGTYPYYCIPHVNQGMTGTITVEDSSN